MENFISFFECGRLVKNSERSMVYFMVSKFADINEKIIPFFSKHGVAGNKYLDFQDWCKAANVIQANNHLTKEGLAQLL